MFSFLPMWYDVIMNSGGIQVEKNLLPWLQEFVRKIIIKTNPYWPFSRLNKICYFLAIKALIQECKKYSMIKSVYLRSSLAEGTFLPGLSDIDYTIIIDSELSIEKELHFLNSFWKNFMLITRLFPMLKDISIINDSQIKTWTRFNFIGYESKNWRLIYGTETVDNNYIASPKRLTIDSMNCALTNYLYTFQLNFETQEEPRWLNLMRLQRIVYKALWYANYSNSYDNKDTKDYIRLGTKTDIFCYLIKEFEIAVLRFFTSFYPKEDRKMDKNELMDILGSIDSYDISAEKLASLIKRLDIRHEAIEGVFLTPQTFYTHYVLKVLVVIQDGLDNPTIKNCIDIVTLPLAKENVPFAIVTHSILKYFLRFHNPFAYLSFIKNGPILHNKDLLSEFYPPDKYSFVKFLLDRFADTLRLIYFYLIFPLQNSAEFCDKKLLRTLEWTMFVKLYLERGLIKTSISELLAEYEKHYPEYYKKFSELKENLSPKIDKIQRLEWVRLLKSMVDDVQDSIMASYKDYVSTY